MRFKLDENFGRSIQEVLEEAGHDARTVHEENLQGAPDPEILAAATSEDRILITMDHGFGNVLIYDHKGTAGVAVINAPGRPTLALLRLLTATLLKGLTIGEIRGRLWIVEPGRIREHQREIRD